MIRAYMSQSLSREAILKLTWFVKSCRFHMRGIFPGLQNHLMKCIFVCKWQKLVKQLHQVSKLGPQKPNYKRLNFRKGVPPSQKKLTHGYWRNVSFLIVRRRIKHFSLKTNGRKKKSHFKYITRLLAVTGIYVVPYLPVPLLSIPSYWADRMLCVSPSCPSERCALDHMDTLPSVKSEDNTGIRYFNFQSKI